MKVPGTRPAASGLRTEALALTLVACSGCGIEPDEPFALEARSAMVSAVGARFRLDPSRLDVRDFDRAVWTDDCYGIDQERECRAGTHFGYELAVRIGAADYVYHALAEDPYQLMLAAAPDPAIGDPALDARWPGVDGVCQSLQVAQDGLAAVGVCGGPHAAHSLLGELERPQEWRYFVDRFAAFELVGEDRDIAFRGMGAERPAPPWQRAIAAWASLQWFEIHAGAGVAGAGRLMLVRRRVAEIATGIPTAAAAIATDPAAARTADAAAADPLGATADSLAASHDDCWFVEVMEYGRAFVSRSACSSAAATLALVGSTWIEDATWQRLVDMYVSWSPLIELEREVEFNGQGDAPVGARERAELLEIVDGLLRAAGGEVR